MLYIFWSYAFTDIYVDCYIFLVDHSFFLLFNISLYIINTFCLKFYFGSFYFCYQIFFYFSDLAYIIFLSLYLSVKSYFTCVSYKNPEAISSIHSDYLYHFIGEYNLFIFIVITHLFRHISTLLVVFSFYHIFLCFLPPFCSLMG